MYYNGNNPQHPFDAGIWKKKHINRSLSEKRRYCHHWSRQSVRCQQIRKTSDIQGLSELLYKWWAVSWIAIPILCWSAPALVMRIVPSGTTKSTMVMKHLEAALRYYISQTNLSSAFLHNGSGENPASYSLRLLSLEFSGRSALAAV